MAATAVQEYVETVELTAELLAEFGIKPGTVKRSDRQKLRDRINELIKLDGITDPGIVKVARAEYEGSFGHLAGLLSARSDKEWTGEQVYEVCEQLLARLRG